jgi:hypothetical protein
MGILKSFSSACLAVLLSLPIVADAAEHVWQRIRQDQGVVTYSSALSGSDIIAVKAVVQINAGMEEVLAVLDDAAYRKEWVPYLVESRVLKKYSSMDKLEYSLFGSPWPAMDRDFVYRQRLLYRDTEKIVFAMQSEQSDLMPERGEIIRAELIESRYTLSAINNNQTQVELIFSADPKGWLPHWLVNKIQEKLPHQMLRNLRNKIEGK